MRENDDALATVVQARDAIAATEGENAFVLKVTAGPEKGQSFRLDPAQATRILIGQSPACELRVSDREVSRRHAALERVGSTLHLRDLGSTNGTWVDRVRVIEAELQGGEMLRVGQTVLRVEREAAKTMPALSERTSFGRVVGASREMRKLYPLCERLAQANVPVIIEGETGTGKEALAESLHEEGPRAAGPFVVFDCTAVPPNLVEAELFGHERGAFTGAVASRRGVFEQAHGGTLLIDEIGDLELALQAKLLRAIERSEVRRVGGDRSMRFDVRILSATRRDLDKEVQAGRFRDDLFHRLAVARIELPPLRHRRGDITALTHTFWKALGGDPALLTPDLLSKWEDYPWPGNVRELRNTIARQIALGDLADVSLGDTGGYAESPVAAAPGVDVIDSVIALGLPFPQARDRIHDIFEERFVAALLEAHGGDVAKAAQASGIGRRYFQKLRARSR